MKNFIIYEIFNESLNFRYIGSTCNFSSRKATHKTHCKKQLKLKLYETINENGGWDNFTMRPIEEVVCENKLEARMRERYWCEMYNPNLNMRKAYTSIEEKESYYEDNKDRFKQYQKEYRDENKDKYLQYQKEYRGENKGYFKQYYKENREKILKYRKQRWLRQKEYRKLKKGIYISPEDLTEGITEGITEEITLKIHEPETDENLLTSLVFGEASVAYDNESHLNDMPVCLQELKYLDNIDAPTNSIITNTRDTAQREEKQTLESIDD